MTSEEMTSEEQAGTSPASRGEAPAGGAAAAPPDNPEELKQEIERTRAQLGETVEALAAKADVKGRAQRRATEVSRRLRGKARYGARRVKDKVADRATAMATSGVRAYSTTAAAVTGALILAWLTVRRLHR